MGGRNVRIGKYIGFYVDFFFHPIYDLRPSILSPSYNSRTSDPVSHGRLFSPPTYPLRFVPCIFFSREDSALSSLVDSRRIIALTHHARTLLGALSS